MLAKVTQSTLKIEIRGHKRGCQTPIGAPAVSTRVTSLRFHSRTCTRRPYRELWILVFSPRSFLLMKMNPLAKKSSRADFDICSKISKLLLRFLGAAVFFVVRACRQRRPSMPDRHAVIPLPRTDTWQQPWPLWMLKASGSREFTDTVAWDHCPELWDGTMVPSYR